MSKIISIENVFAPTDNIKVAAERLIGLQKCKTHPTEDYTIPVYGNDINILDTSRKWLYKNLISKGESPSLARISANKQILYVRESDLLREAGELA